jgi:hypothetical protein
MPFIIKLAVYFLASLGVLLFTPGGMFKDMSDDLPESEKDFSRRDWVVFIFLFILVVHIILGCISIFVLLIWGIFFKF